MPTAVAAPAPVVAAPPPDDSRDAGDRWFDAALAAMLFAVDPHGLGGVHLRAGAGPVRDAWLRLLRCAWPTDAPWRRLPAQATEDRVLGGLDLAATLRSGRPVAQRGLLAEADGGAVLVAMAERLPMATAAQLCAALDRGEVVAARDGVSLRESARVGVVAFDEAGPDDPPPPGALTERLGLAVDLHGVGLSDVGGFDPDLPAPDVVTHDPALQADVRRARLRLAGVTIGETELVALAGAALALGVDALRPSWLAVRVARAHAAWRGGEAVDAEDAGVAVRLVLAPRATRLPQVAPPDDEPPGAETGGDAPPPADPPEPQAHRDDPAEAPEDGSDADDQPPPLDPGALQDCLVEAALASMPPHLLARLAMSAAGARSPGVRSGRAGPAAIGLRRGSPAGVRRGMPGRGARMSLIDTLRAAAPWQRLRGVADPSGAVAAAPRGRGRRRSQAPERPRIAVRPEDFHIRRYRQRGETTTVFVVDASGSAALQRLAEAKGAVELLLADCYVRRDSVAMVAFRGTGAELLLPPTRSLVRARRSLAGLPGGGGTPLAAGLDLAFGIADGVRRRGDLPLVVVMTDGRANIARDGTPGRDRADADARASARVWRAAGLKAMVVDLSAKPHPAARALAAEMGAAYLPLPYADARVLSQAVSGAAAVAQAGGADGRRA